MLPCVQFTDLSKNATGRKWNFGGGTSSVQQNLTHTYSAAGNYTVNLTVSNANGTDSDNYNISVIKKEEISTLFIKKDDLLREASPEGVFSNSLFLDVGGLSGVDRYRDVLSFNLNKYTGSTQIKSATIFLFWYYPNNSCFNALMILLLRSTGLLLPGIPIM